MDETFLKTISEHDRNVLEQCVRLSYQQTRDQVSKLWDIYIKKEELMKKHSQNKEAKNEPLKESKENIKKLE